VPNSVTHISDGEAGRYIRESILCYLGDPPDTDFQVGYLAALVDVYRECLGQEGGDRIKLAASLIYPDEARHA
tara:strand:+ start:1077 stop:1295 length:219 start_codon:yes stop_codon:yes gene_type:complete